MTETMRREHDLANAKLRQLIHDGRVSCNCGGPQYATGHSPDCAVVLSWDDCLDDARDEIYQSETGG